MSRTNMRWKPVSPEAPLAGVLVVVEVWPPGPAYLDGEGKTIQAAIERRADADGALFALPPNEEITPLETVYRLRAFTVPEVQPDPIFFTAPVSGAELRIMDYLTDPPGSLDPSGLAQHQAHSPDRHHATDVSITGDLGDNVQEALDTLEEGGGGGGGGTSIQDGLGLFGAIGVAEGIQVLGVMKAHALVPQAWWGRSNDDASGSSWAPAIGELVFPVTMSGSPEIVTMAGRSAWQFDSDAKYGTAVMQAPPADGPFAIRVTIRQDEYLGDGAGLLGATEDALVELVQGATPGEIRLVGGGSSLTSTLVIGEVGTVWMIFDGDNSALWVEGSDPSVGTLDDVQFGGASGSFYLASTMTQAGRCTISDILVLQHVPLFEFGDPWAGGPNGYVFGSSRGSSGKVADAEHQHQAIENFYVLAGDGGEGDDWFESAPFTQMGSPLEDLGVITTDGVMLYHAINAPSNSPVKKIRLLSGATALSGCRHLWVAYYGYHTEDLLGQSPDEPGAVWPANTTKEFVLPDPVSWFRDISFFAIMQDADQHASLKGFRLPFNTSTVGTSDTGLTDTAPSELTQHPTGDAGFHIRFGQE